MATVQTLLVRDGARGVVGVLRETLMRLSTVVVPAVLAASVAQAHIKLNQPPEWLVTDAYGDPQKTGPCGVPNGAGTLSDAGPTVVHVGDQLTVQWKETVMHPGHFRIAIAQDRNDLFTPDASVVANDCRSAPIESSPVLPVVADGLFRDAGYHSTGANYSYTITVPQLPTLPCTDCTLQVLQFMEAHPPSCFYFHCARITVLPRDAGVVDAGMTDGGAGGGAGGGSGASGGGAASSGGGEASGGGAAASGGGAGATGGGSGATGGGSAASGGGSMASSGGGNVPAGGCGCTSGEGAQVAALLLLSLGAVAFRRRAAR